MSVHYFEMQTTELRVALHDCQGGLSGVRTMMHINEGKNVFFPGMGGLNFEYIFDGVQPQSEVLEPRLTPMRLEPVSETSAVLHQEPTPFWRIESHITYQVISPYYIDLLMEFIPRAIVSKSDYLGVFWCNYLNEPQDRRLHFIGYEMGYNNRRWMHVDSPMHRVESAFYYNDKQEQRLSKQQASPVLALNRAWVRYLKPFYYGLHGDFAFIMMFNDPEHTVFAHSPTAGRPGDPRHPAWDFAFLMESPEVDQVYRFKTRLAYKYFKGADDVEKEWLRWVNGCGGTK